MQTDPVHYVGIDLAWGQKRPTGVAVLDERGRLLHVGSVTSDEEITAAVAPYTAGACLVAFDAPLVVTNATGNRPAETALNADFRPFEAGTHPVNLGKPEMADGPRAGRLAAELRLDTAPGSRARRRAIEVYPHPATVALFRLDRTLKYKQKKDRSFAELRAALLTLMAHLEELNRPRSPLLLARRPAWEDLVARVERATRKSELRHVEDQVDAVLCAYVGLFADHEPDRTTVYGDGETGYIVTPTLPEGLTPAPRQPRAERVRNRAVEAYAAQLPRTQEATAAAEELVRGILDDAGINYLSITSRAKSVASFAEKAADTVDGRPRYTDPLAEMADQIGIRVVTHVASDVAAVADLMADELTVLGDRDKGAETARAGRWGYASRHLDLAAPTDGALPPGMDALLAGRIIEVQVRTVLQHAWAEFEHDVRYKGDVPAEHATELDRRFTLAAGLLELADREFSEIREQLRSGAGVRGGGRRRDGAVAAGDLASYLAGRYPGAGWSRTDHYEWIAGLLLELGVTSTEELADAMASVDSAAVTAAMNYRYPPGAVRRLDDDLLATYGTDYVDLPGNADRAPLLRSRLTKLLSPGR